jgi:predicted transcriptional regulator
MKTSVQARLDEDSQAALQRLATANGWTTSRVIRESILFMDENRVTKPRRKMIGIGKFDSGIGDLATNKKHMEDFGVKSMGKGWVRPQNRATE